MANKIDDAEEVEAAKNLARAEWEKSKVEAKAVSAKAVLDKDLAQKKSDLETAKADQAASAAAVVAAEELLKRAQEAKKTGEQAAETAKANLDKANDALEDAKAVLAKATTKQAQAQTTHTTAKELVDNDDHESAVATAQGELDKTRATKRSTDAVVAKMTAALTMVTEQNKSSAEDNEATKKQGLAEVAYNLARKDFGDAKTDKPSPEAG